MNENLNKELYLSVIVFSCIIKQIGDGIPKITFSSELQY